MLTPNSVNEILGQLIAGEELAKGIAESAIPTIGHLGSVFNALSAVQSIGRKQAMAMLMADDVMTREQAIEATKYLEAVYEALLVSAINLFVNGRG